MTCHELVSPSTILQLREAQVAAEVTVRAAAVRRSRQAPWISALPESMPLPEACAAGDLACALEFLHVRCPQPY